MRDTRSVSTMDEGQLYRRESFRDKEILIPFDANFNKLDEQTMRSQYIGKNIAELRHTIDSVNLRLDSISANLMQGFRGNAVVGVPAIRYSYRDTVRVAEQVELPQLKKALNIDSIRGAMPTDKQLEMVNMAINKASRVQQDFLFQGAEVADDVMTIRRHEIEMLRKYTLSLACLIFFFIGAPLGAIIRKGGLGTPIVISVLLFIVYYINQLYGMSVDRSSPICIIFLRRSKTFAVNRIICYLSQTNI